MIQIGRLETTFPEAVFNRLPRKARPVLYPIKALFFGRCYDSPIDEQACGRVTVVRIDAENRGQRSSQPEVTWPVHPAASTPQPALRQQFLVWRRFDALLRGLAPQSKGTFVECRLAARTGASSRSSRSSRC